MFLLLTSVTSETLNFVVLESTACVGPRISSSKCDALPLSKLFGQTRLADSNGGAHHPTRDQAVRPFRRSSGRSTIALLLHIVSQVQALFDPLYVQTPPA